MEVAGEALTEWPLHLYYVHTFVHIYSLLSCHFHSLPVLPLQRNLPAESKELLKLFKRLCVSHSSLVLMGHMEGEEEEAAHRCVV